MKQFFAIVAAVMILVGTMFSGGCDSANAWSDAKADAVEARSKALIDDQHVIMASTVATPEEKAKAADREQVEKAKLELLDALRADAHKDDADVAAIKDSLGIASTVAPGWGGLVGIVGTAGVLVWQEWRRRSSGKALNQLAAGLNAGKAVSPELRAGLDAAKWVIGNYLDTRSRDLVDAARLNPANRPNIVVSSPSASGAASVPAAKAA